MWCVQRVLVVPAVFLGFIFMSVFPVAAEDIYRWKGPNGAQCFSNVSPPGRVVEFSVIAAASPESRATAAGEAASDANDAGMAAVAKEEPDTGPDSMEAFLLGRIRSRKRSIEQMKTRLRSASNDDALRRRIFKKKQQLHEDVIRLELIPEKRK